jgi:hypothetical protein
LGPAFGTTLFGDGEVKEVAAKMAEVCGGVFDSAGVAGTGLEFETEVLACGECISLAPVYLIGTVISLPAIVPAGTGSFLTG